MSDDDGEETLGSFYEHESKPKPDIPDDGRIQGHINVPKRTMRKATSSQRVSLKCGVKRQCMRSPGKIRGGY